MPAPGENVSLPTQEVTWLKRDLLLFAASIGVGTDELNFVFVRFFLPEVKGSLLIACSRSKMMSLRRSPRTHVFYVCHKLLD